MLSRITVFMMLFWLFMACDARNLYQMKVGDHELYVEVASDEESRSKGLMSRRSLKENQGMLFLFESEKRVSFWMKNTFIPLSIAFIGSDGEIYQIEDMVPESLAPVRSIRSILYALEVNQGWFEEHDIAVGDRVELPGRIAAGK